MKPTFSERAVNLLIKKNAISLDDKELYVYGFNQLALSLLNIVTSIVVGLLFSMLLETVLFMLVYIPLRSYAGGYHANTKLNCYFFSILLIIVSLIIIKNTSIGSILFVVLAITSIMIIILLSPIQNKNKPLDSLEKKVYKKRTLMILLFWILTVAVCDIINLNQIVLSILVAFIMLSIILLLGKLKNYILDVKSLSKN